MEQAPPCEGGGDPNHQNGLGVLWALEGKLTSQVRPRNWPRLSYHRARLWLGVISTVTMEPVGILFGKMRNFLRAYNFVVRASNAQMPRLSPRPFCGVLMEIRMQYEYRCTTTPGFPTSPTVLINAAQQADQQQSWSEVNPPTELPPRRPLNHTAGIQPLYPPADPRLRSQGVQPCAEWHKLQL